MYSEDKTLKIFHNHVYPCVSTLGGKSDAYQKLPCLIIVKCMYSEDKTLL